MRSTSQEWIEVGTYSGDSRWDRSELSQWHRKMNEQATTATEALIKNSESMNKVNGALKEMGIFPIRLETQSFQLETTFHTSDTKQAPSVLNIGRLEKWKASL